MLNIRDKDNRFCYFFFKVIANFQKIVLQIDEKQI